jgi:hypothetical protein
MIALIAAALFVQAQTADPVYWTSCIYPETLESEATARAHTDIVRRDGVNLSVIYDGKTVATLQSSDLPSETCAKEGIFWLFSGTVQVGPDRLAVVRRENGHGGREAIVRPDGTLFWTEGPPWASPDGQWIVASADLFDEMDDSRENNSLYIYRWGTADAVKIIPGGCRVTGWTSATAAAVLCADTEGDLALENGEWSLHLPEMKAQPDQ